jgi:hypothetical protein
MYDLKQATLYDLNHIGCLHAFSFVKDGDSKEKN